MQCMKSHYTLHPKSFFLRICSGYIPICDWFIRLTEDVIRWQIILLLPYVARALGQVAPTLPMFAKAKAAAYNILEMINRKQDQQQISSFRKGKVLSQVNGHIEFCNVSFRYPSRPEARVFDKLCLSIPAGKSVAIVGSSGSGKSTVISLIERFYDPTSGTHQS